MIVTYHEITRDHKEWAAFLGITEQTFRWRMKHWGLHRTVSTPKVAPKNRRKSRSVDLTIEDKERAVTAYVEGDSEDDIAADLGISRRELSRLLCAWGLKRRGKAPERVITDGSKASVRATPQRIHITIAA